MSPEADWHNVGSRSSLDELVAQREDQAQEARRVIEALEGRKQEGLR